MARFLKDQYALIKNSREVVLNFVDTQVKEDWNIPVALCNHQTIRYLFEHCAGCYGSWLADFALQYAPEPIPNVELITIDTVRALYGGIDSLVEAFLNKYEFNLEVPIIGVHNACGEVSATPLALFTHVITHEFHHKGQLMLMCRILGHTPPETDVSLFFG